MLFVEKPQNVESLCIQVCLQMKIHHAMVNTVLHLKKIMNLKDSSIPPSCRTLSMPPCCSKCELFSPCSAGVFPDKWCEMLPLSPDA